jgi:hypothetical protein
MLDNWLFRQTNPKQTQFKAKTNPIASKGKIDAKFVCTKDYEEICGYWHKKTKPIQTQFKPNFPKGQS